MKISPAHLAHVSKCNNDRVSFLTIVKCEIEYYLRKNIIYTPWNALKTILTGISTKIKILNPDQNWSSKRVLLGRRYHELINGEL